MDILKKKEWEIVKQISKLDFEKDIINKLIEIFNVNQREIDQVNIKKDLKSTKPLKVNNRKRKRYNNKRN